MATASSPWMGFRMGQLRIRTGIQAGMLASVFLLSQARAQDTLIPIHVMFQFGDPAIPAAPAMEQALTAALTEQLQQEWRLWRFVPVTAPQYPLLRLGLQRNLE